MTSFATGAIIGLWLSIGTIFLFALVWKSTYYNSTTPSEAEVMGKLAKDLLIFMLLGFFAPLYVWFRIHKENTKEQINP